MRNREGSEGLGERFCSWVSDGHCFVTTASLGAPHGGKDVGIGGAARGGGQPGTSWCKEEVRRTTPGL